ncbi:hypothetical protein [Microaceticoccus formicicus]|uniref:hypothetical protein n=1 Tax=Microaceticoccus formicicus TaxID=3118105 RepID=UPI003CCFF715|nr:hypothetical protein VZL98_08095 [Peptoniphilaceae bacterium AMB_02]
MKRKTFLTLIIGLTFLLTSCKFIDQAVEDTFAQQPEKLIKDQADEEKFLGKIKGAFFDASNERVSSFYIIEDAEDKMGFEFPTKLASCFRTYLIDNDINHYLAKEEVEEILRSYKADNLLLNNDNLHALIEDLRDQVGAKDFYIYKKNIRVYNHSLYVYVIDPENQNHVDLYYYNLSNDSWHIIPEKIKADVDPMENSILLSEINFSSYKKMVDKGIELLKEIGDYNEYNLMTDDLGFDSIYTPYNGPDLLFKARLQGSREDYDLTFDADGNLIEKERR